MNRQQISRKTTSSSNRTRVSRKQIPTPSYEPLSSVVQRAQQDPKSLSGDEWQALDSAIGTRAVREILAGKKTPWVPEFKGISEQLWGNSEQKSEPIEAKAKEGGEKRVPPFQFKGISEQLWGKESSERSESIQAKVNEEVELSEHLTAESRETELGGHAKSVKRTPEMNNSITPTPQTAGIQLRATNPIIPVCRKNPALELKATPPISLANGGVVQAKLTIGEPNDKYEQEADRVAAEVVQQINRPAPVSQAQGDVVQGKKSEEDELRMKSKVQGYGLKIGGGVASRELETEIDRARGGGRPLDAGLQESMGQAMGADFSLVRVHTDERSDQLNQSIQARAFTTGQDVFFRQGAYEPRSTEGQELLAHELTHVVQQSLDHGNRAYIRRGTKPFGGKRESVKEARNKTASAEAESSRLLNESGLTVSEVGVIKDYTTDSTILNKVARGQSDLVEEQQKAVWRKIKMLDGALKKFPIHDSPIKTYRYVYYEKIDENPYLSVKPGGNSIEKGDYVASRGFLSTSINQQMIQKEPKKKKKEGAQGTSVRMKLITAKGRNIAAEMLSIYNNKNMQLLYNQETNKKSKFYQMMSWIASSGPEAGQAETLIPRGVIFLRQRNEMGRQGNVDTRGDTD